MASTAAGLDLVPQGVERGEIGRAKVDAALGRQLFDTLEAGAELVGGRPQRQFGIDVEMAGHVDHSEQQVAEFVVLGDGVVVVDRRAELAGFLDDLRERTVDVGPVEADLRRLCADLGRVGERRHRAWNAVEDRRPLLLLALDVFPVGEHLIDGTVAGTDIDHLAVAAEHVGVAADQLVVDARRDIGDRETSLLLGDRGVELDLVEEVTKLLDEVIVGRRVVGVERLEGVDDLVGLLQEDTERATRGSARCPRDTARGACAPTDGSVRTPRRPARRARGCRST